jgi:magnesium transporter
LLQRHYSRQECHESSFDSTRAATEQDKQQQAQPPYPQRHTNEIALICNELDSNGHLHVTCGRFLKSALCQAHGLQPRDLRKLDGTLKNQLPVILIRTSALLVNLDYIKAIINHNAVTFFESVDQGERLKQHDFLMDLQTKLQTRHTTGTSTSSSQPFEFVVLEAMLQKLLNSLQDDFDRQQPLIINHLSALERHVHWERLKIILQCKKQTLFFLEQVQNIRDCLKELLESDVDMANMYLTHKARAKQRPITAHEEIELLLESYLKQAEELASRAELLAADIQATEDIVNIGLVSQRNELLLLELKLGIGTFAAAMGGLIASVLGMNLVNSFEGSPLAFWYVVSMISGVGALSFGMAWRRMLRLIK